METDSGSINDATALAGARRWQWHIGLLVLVLVGVLLLLGSLLRDSHRQAVNKAYADGTNLAKVLERQLDASLRRLDANLQFIVGRVQPADLDAAVAPRQRAQWSQTLDGLKINFAEVMDFYVINQHGDVLYSSGAFKSLNVVERAHFRQLQRDASDRLVWSDVVLSKANGRPTMVLARALHNRAGEFVGIVSALVDMDYFQKSIAALDIGAHGLISVRDTNNYKLLLRQPPIASEVNKASKSSIFGRILQGERLGSYHFKSPLDGLYRYTTFLALQDFPFVVTVALGEDDVLAPWRSQALASTLIAAVLVLLVGLVLRRLWLAEQARQRTVAELLIARDNAQEASRSKGQFLANMSHEIRTPMNAVLGMLNLLQSTALTRRQTDYVRKTEVAAKSLLGLLNDILDFSKVEAGKMALENEPFSLTQLLRDISVVLSGNVGAKNIEVLFDVDPQLPVWIRGDSLRLMQVLINLGGNAVKFTAQGQVVLTLRQLAAENNTVTVEFAVQDTGIGIAPAHQKHIFHGFSQAETSTTRRYGGSGLGLAICKRLVELMGGEIALTSSAGRGSRFSFSVTFAVVNGGADPLLQPRLQSLGPQRALIVDDNPVAREIHRRIVESWGWSADTASSGAQALQMFQSSLAAGQDSSPYALVLLDSQMPDLDGWQTARSLQQCSTDAGRKPPMLIMLSSQGRDALASRSDAEQALVAGFLVKPVTASLLLDAVMEHAGGPLAPHDLDRARPAGRHLSGMRILVVEDNLINQQVADELLSAEGAVVTLAANGQLGVEAVQWAEPPFDVVLMDIQMPVLDGYEATRRIRSLGGFADLPIVAMTANALQGDRESCLAAGMNAHIGKPFDMAALVSLLIRVTGFAAPVAHGQSSAASSTDVPRVEGLDLPLAISRMAGMRSLYVRTAQDFRAALATLPAELKALLDAGDAAQARLLLHTIKGNAGTVGATTLEKEAASLELASTAPDGLAHCLDRLAGLTALVDATRAALQRAVAALCQDDATNPPPAVPAPAAPAAATVRAALRELQSLAQVGELTALQRFAELQAQFRDLPPDLLAALEAALQRLDLDEVSRLCARALEAGQS